MQNKLLFISLGPLCVKGAVIEDDWGIVILSNYDVRTIPPGILFTAAVPQGHFFAALRAQLPPYRTTAIAI